MCISQEAPRTCMSYQLPPLPSAFSVHSAGCDVGVCQSFMAVSKFANSQATGCM